MSFKSTLALSCYASTLLLFAQLNFAHEAPRLKPTPDKKFHKPDPCLAQAWHLNAIRAAQAWKVSLGNPATTIAFIDSGIDYNNEDLSSNIKRNIHEWPPDGKDSDKNGLIDDFMGWDFVRSHYLPFDRTGHGTFLAGLAVATYRNGVATAGVCPRCSVLPLRFMNWEGLGDTEDAIRAVYYAIKMGVRVINLSFSSEGYDRALYLALEQARRHDIVVVAAASNDGVNLDRNPIYPAKYDLPNQLTIGASNRSDELWDGSNWGHRTVQMMAPGEDVVSIWETGCETGSGTSDSAAIVSGAVGLLRSIAPELSAGQIVKIVLRGARKVAGLKGKSKTEGILDVSGSLKYILDSRMATNFRVSHWMNVFPEYPNE